MIWMVNSYNGISDVKSNNDTLQNDGKLVDINNSFEKTRKIIEKIYKIVLNHY